MRKLAALALTTVTAAFVIVVTVGLYQLLNRY